METQGTQNNKNNLQKQPSWKTHFNFKTCYKAIVIKTVWFQNQNRHISQWKRNENTEINLHVYDQLIFNKDTKIRKWRKNNLLNKWCERMKLGPYFMPSAKVN